MNETWKEISGYEGKYFVSPTGKVKNQDGLILKPIPCTNGYLSVCLWLQGNPKKYLLHRLVAMAFLDNPNGYNEINHIDEDKTNNSVDNLEWCSHRYNMNYGHVKEKISRAGTGRHLTEEHKRKCASTKGKKWMTNGITERLVKEEEIPSFLLHGYRVGRNLTEEQKERMLANCRKKVIANGAVFDSLTACAKFYNISLQDVSKLAAHKRFSKNLRIEYWEDEACTRK